MLEIGRVVRSGSGHDKDGFYVIVEVLCGRVAIADGKRRKLGKPKQKNTLHVRPTNLVLDMHAVTTDKKLRQALAPLGKAAPEDGGN